MDTLPELLLSVVAEQDSPHQYNGFQALKAESSLQGSMDINSHRAKRPREANGRKTYSEAYEAWEVSEDEKLRGIVDLEGDFAGMSREGKKKKAKKPRTIGADGKPVKSRVHPSLTYKC